MKYCRHCDSDVELIDKLKAKIKELEAELEDVEGQLERAQND